ncbi:MAG: GH3 auxin-responsive promoter family protein [Oscillospiraceae bacterium]|nr:GH3 auxin-responsive promoter family protein [Oscillospiraceae bacterium]
MEDKKLGSIITNNQNTVYGNKYSYGDIRNISDYQKNVPFSTYEDYAPYIERIKNKESNILTSEPVLLLEPTSGSASAKKLIPYTRGLQREFSSAIYKWLWNLNRNFPRLKYGQFYFSITPQGNTTDGIEGFNTDDEYIGGLLGKFVAKKFCVPASVKSIEDMDLFWKTTIDYIKQAKKLRLVSIWNPTFLLIMLEKSNMRAKDLFPHLEVISCWADGNSATYAEQLQKAFPDAYMQPKGLLATEGIMTIPIEGVGKRLTDSHFFEFIDKNNDVRLKDQLDKDDEYEIVLTTSGGLYRYRIGDIVRYNGNQCFDFIGKAGNISDYFGEKLNEMHVREVVPKNGFCLLVPNENRYVLYTETEADADTIDAALRGNFHYDYCRKLGQLKKVEVVVVENGAQQYIDNCVRFGMRLGDIKPMCLSNRQGWVFK